MNTNEHGSVTGKVRGLLKLEGAAIFLFALSAYEFLGFSWGTFILMFFIPDLTLLAYFYNSRWGAVAYNLSHAYIFPLMLFAYGFFVSKGFANQCALVWIAHVGFDRALGFGLKYGRGFRYTHLGKLGQT